jgi:hypothetical protein
LTDHFQNPRPFVLIINKENFFRQAPPLSLLLDWLSLDHFYFAHSLKKLTTALEGGLYIPAPGLDINDPVAPASLDDKGIRECLSN